MLKQTYDREAIAKSISKRDVWKWSLWNNESEKEIKISNISNKIKSKDYKISNLKVERNKGKETYLASNSEDAILLRILDKYIRRIYKVKQADRSSIVHQIKTLLSDTSDLVVLRVDIESCYESINFQKLIERLSNDMLLSPTSLKILNSVFDRGSELGQIGLPRGICISATLAELFLERIDSKMKKLDGVIYFTRYVDDYLLFIDRKNADLVKTTLKNELDSIDLGFQEESEKYFLEGSTGQEFVYLGYEFFAKTKKRSENQVSLTISDEKISKIKKKIALSFKDYIKNSDFNLLSQRINYLSSVRIIKSHENGNLLGGIAYSYQSVTDNFECVKKIDSFYIGQLHQHLKLFNEDQKKILFKKSFYGSVRNQKKGIFTRKKMKTIAKIWKNVKNN